MNDTSMKTNRWNWLTSIMVGCWLLPLASMQAAAFYSAIDFDAKVPLSTSIPAETQLFATAETLDDISLDALRGGFSVSGMELNFGAVLKTQVDSMQLESIIKIDRFGSQLTAQSLNGMPVTALPDDIQVQMVSAGGIVNGVAPGTLSLGGLKDYSGLALNDSKGFTAALHNITKQAIVSAVVSDASQRTVQQTVDINIDVRNMPALRSASQRQAIVNSLTR